MSESQASPVAAEPEPASERFKHLPQHVRPEDTVATKATRAAQDPEAGRDTDRDFMLRYGAG